MKEKYHIYNYFKNHEGALIATVSGIAGFIIMALNFVLYITDRFYLSEWDCFLIPVENSPSRFYTLCIWLVFFISYIFLGHKLGKASIEFQKELTTLKSYLHRIKKIKIRLNEYENDYTNVDNNNSTSQNNQTKIDLIKQEIRSVRADVIKKIITLPLITFVKILFLAAVCSVPITLMKYIQTFEFIQSLKSTLTSIGLLLIFLIVISLLLVTIFSKKNIIEPKNLEFSSKKLLSDSMIIQNCKSTAWIFAIIVGQILLNTFLENISKRDFEIFSIDNQEYASIYESEHYLIGKKISYEDSTITFYLNKQIVVEKINLSITKKTFEKVEKINEFPHNHPNIGKVPTISVPAEICNSQAVQGTD